MAGQRILIPLIVVRIHALELNCTKSTKWTKYSEVHEHGPKGPRAVNCDLRCSELAAQPTSVSTISPNALQTQRQPSSGRAAESQGRIALACGGTGAPRSSGRREAGLSTIGSRAPLSTVQLTCAPGRHWGAAAGLSPIGSCAGGPRSTVQLAGALGGHRSAAVEDLAARIRIDGCSASSSPSPSSPPSRQAHLARALPRARRSLRRVVPDVLVEAPALYSVKATRAGCCRTLRQYSTRASSSMATRPP